MTPTRSAVSCLVFFALALRAAPDWAQAQQTLPAASGGITPPPPQGSEMIARDSEGRVTVRATRLAQPLQLDGELGEGVYGLVQPFGDFIQQEPHEGQPATDRTEVWVFYDDKNVYVSARMTHSRPDTIIANEMRRDAVTIWSTNDNIGVVLDTFHDRRSAYFFQTNALGAVRDAFLMDENRNVNLDFNAVWDVRSRRYLGGWTTEMEIPFKSIRYAARRDQVWGLNIQRVDRARNEFSHLTPMPASYGGVGIWRVSVAATLVGIEAPGGGGTFELKPYALSSVASDSQARPPVSDDLKAEFGFDAKYEVTKSLTTDFTYNTDFAQIEVDNQQVNLTRFSLFYPEKREFFLQGQNTFSFGGQGALIFFSRRIGLTANGAALPIAAGGRLLGRAGPYTLGATSIRTDASSAAASPATTFSVVRVKRDILSRSAIGIIATARSPSATAAGSNQVIGVDASLGLLQDVEANAYYARSWTPGLSGDEATYRAQMRYAGDRYGVEADRTRVGPSFNPEIGFVARTDMVRHYFGGRFSPRPKGLRGVRKLSWEPWLENISGTNGIQQTRVVGATFRIYEENGDEFNATHTRTDDRPQTAFSAAGVAVEPGSYRFGETRVNYVFGPRWAATGTASLLRGSYYGGRRTELSYTGRVALTAQFMIEPIVRVNWLALPQASLTSRLVSARVTYTLTPRIMLAALTQYNSTTARLGTNVRLRWEYRPGSDLFVVYSDERDTLGETGSGALNHSVAVKLTRLLRY